MKTPTNSSLRLVRDVASVVGIKGASKESIYEATFRCFGVDPSSIYYLGSEPIPSNLDGYPS
jgi:hypothetical protein